MRFIAQQRNPYLGGRSKPRHIGTKPNGFSVFGRAFRELAGNVLRGLKTVVVAAGRLAQKVLDAASAFPVLKGLLKTPVPLPVIGALSVETILKGVAATGMITERIANAIEVYNQTKDLTKALRELPIAELVLFILSPILESFQGVLAIVRVGKPVPPERFKRVIGYLKGMLKRFPRPLKLAVVNGIERKLNFRLPQAMKTQIISA